MIHHEQPRLYPLRADQQHLVEQIEQALPLHPKLHLCEPGGSGKTEILTTLAARAVARDKRVLISLPTAALRDQTYARFLAGYGPEWTTANCSILSKHAMPSAINIATSQLLTSQNKSGLVPDFDLMLVDESHYLHSIIETLQAARPSARYVGFTATPETTKCWQAFPYQILGHMTQELISGSTSQWRYDDTDPLATAGGILSPMKHLVPRYSMTHEDFADCKTNAANHLGEKDYQAKDVTQRMNSKLVGDTRFMAYAAQTTIEYACDAAQRPTIVFCIDQQHAKDFASLLAESGQRVGLFVSDNPSLSDSEDVKRKLETGELQYLVTVDKASEGFDCPAISCVVSLRPTKSKAKAMQQMLRGSRRHPNKSDCLILDFVSNVTLHWRPDEYIPRSEAPCGTRTSKTSKPIKAYKICPACRETMPVKAVVCDSCGHSLQAEPVVNQEPPKVILPKDMEEATRQHAIAAMDYRDVVAQVKLWQEEKSSIKGSEQRAFRIVEQIYGRKAGKGVTVPKPFRRIEPAVSLDQIVAYEAGKAAKTLFARDNAKRLYQQ